MKIGFGEYIILRNVFLGFRDWLVYMKEKEKEEVIFLRLRVKVRV